MATATGPDRGSFGDVMLFERRFRRHYAALCCHYAVEAKIPRGLKSLWRQEIGFFWSQALCHYAVFRGHYAVFGVMERVVSPGEMGRNIYVIIIEHITLHNGYNLQTA